MRALAAFVVVLALGAAATAGATARTESLGSLPRLTSDVPRFVTQICNSGRAKSPLPLVCPPVVPVSEYRGYAGSSGVLLGNTNIPPVKPPADDIYLVELNGGDAGPTYWHWIAGMGTPQAIHYWVLSDAHNEVKGKPNRVKTLVLEGRLVEIWRFPDYPAGGQFGGHFAAITRSGSYLAIASIHGYDSAAASARMVVALAREADAAR